MTKDDGSVITFQYDGLGNRIAKTEMDTETTTLYVRDAQGNVLAVYENSSDGTVEPVDPDRNLQDFWDFGTMLIDREIAFEAYDYISVANTVNGNVVEPNGNLRLTAGNEITLRPNFHIKPGSEFLAEIRDLGEGNGGREGLFLTEHHIYGSSRLGMERKNLEILEEGPILERTFFENKVGDKRYELSNHLGNVLSVVTDRKISNGEGRFGPDVIAYNDYYPFGMLLPERHGNSSDYRYGFNGMEKDDEIKGEGNSLNYMFRMHDPRVGRFLSLDRLSRAYPWNSPYAFAENRVIDGVDLEGSEWEYYMFMMESNMGLYGETSQKITRGVSKSVVNTAEGIQGVIEDPVGTAKGMGNLLVGILAANAVTNKKQIDDNYFQKKVDAALGTSSAPAMKAFNESIANGKEKLINGDLEDRAELLTDVFTGIIGSKGTEKFVRIGSLAKLGRVTQGLRGAKFAQNKINKTGVFSPKGQEIYSSLAGTSIKTVDDLAAAINNGLVNIKDLPVDFVMRNGEKVILNTRTSTALNRANVDMEDWFGVDRTGLKVPDHPDGKTFDELAEDQISNNYKKGEELSSEPPK